jgi:hypothetical protein
MKTKMLRSIEPSESEIQSAIVEWARNTTIHIGKINPGKVGDYLMKISNEGKRSFSLANKMKKEGLTAGVSDMFLAFPINVGRYNEFIIPVPGLWIEIKSKNGKLSYSQKVWIERMTHIGYPCVVIRSVEEGIHAVKDYLGMK